MKMMRIILLKRRANVRKERAPALPDSTTFQQLWDALGSRLIETAQGHLLYTHGVLTTSTAFTKIK
jgi:hypothetical protein